MERVGADVLGQHEVGGFCELAEWHSGEVRADVLLCDLEDAIAALGILSDLAQHISSFGQLQRL